MGFSFKGVKKAAKKVGRVARKAVAVTTAPVAVPAGLVLARVAPRTKLAKIGASLAREQIRDVAFHAAAGAAIGGAIVGKPGGAATVAALSDKAIAEVDRLTESTLSQTGDVAAGGGAPIHAPAPEPSPPPLTFGRWLLSFVGGAR